MASGRLAPSVGTCMVMGTATASKMARRTKAATEPFDCELSDLPAELRWRDWMGRVEASIFASLTPVPREVLTGLVGRTCWDARYPAIGQAWRRAWEHVTPLFAFPPAIRKMYTTNAVESLHRSLRRIIKTRGSFPTDEAATKLLYLAIQNAGVRWRRPVESTAAMSQFAILFGDRFVISAR